MHTPAVDEKSWTNSSQNRAPTYFTPADFNNDLDDTNFDCVRDAKDIFEGTSLGFDILLGWFGPTISSRHVFNFEMGTCRIQCGYVLFFSRPNFYGFGCWYQC